MLVLFLPIIITIIIIAVAIIKKHEGNITSYWTEIRNYSSKEEIKSWLNKHQITNYTINDDLSVDVDGRVNLTYRNLTEIPVQFKEINGSFFCSNNQLTSLEGAPEKVIGSFSCSNNQLTSLEGAPKEVHGWFWCDNNQLTSLEFLPEIHENLVCDEYLHDTKEYKVWQIVYKLKEMM